MNLYRVTTVAIIVAALGACGFGGIDLAAYEEAVVQWRHDRVASLKAEGGYLNLVGLYWIEPGEYSFGAAPDNDLVFPGTSTPVIGRFVLDEEGVRMLPEPGVDVRYEGIPVRALFLTDDQSENPVIVTHDSLAWGVIQRDGRFAIRLRDFENPALESFPTLDYFPLDLDYRVVGTLRRYDEPRVMNVGTVIEGLGYHPESPGVIEFELDGKSYELEAYQSGDRLFFVFGDKTNAKETYPAGRFLYSLMPGESGKTVLDFNLAYSPPCAFNDFSTCPVASPRNRLPVRIEAGEYYNKEAYLGTVAVN